MLGAIARRLFGSANDRYVRGLQKHVQAINALEADIAKLSDDDLRARTAWLKQRLADGETLAEALAAYADVAARTDALIATLPDLDADHPLPSAPWFQPGTRWSARAVLLHLIAETSQHSGHADIIREALDGQRTMG